MVKTSSASKFLFYTLALSFFFTESAHAFRVVLDPGHGGRYLEPYSVYGDKYNPDTGLFMEPFRPGASIRGMNENEDVYIIALKAKEILDQTSTEIGRKKFQAILDKYGAGTLKGDLNIEAIISRPAGYVSNYGEIAYDINRDYRLYDHHDLLTHEKTEGVISKINNLKPELVVSIHLTGGNPGRHGGLSAVITPSLQTYRLALDYVRALPGKREAIRKEFLNGPYSDWFIGQHGRNAFEWFLCDSWIYFTGYWSLPNGLGPDTDKFRGVRHNLITWNYKDDLPVSPDLNNFTLKGQFWSREMDTPETWRRDGGPQGYGGDNLYASEEILRFIRKGLLVNKVRSQWNLPPVVKPYISTWSVPTYVNAVSAYLEIGYLNNPKDFDRIYRYKNIHAEAIAVGIYSLATGTVKNAAAKKKDMPWGEPVDFDKYRNYNGVNYFEAVR